MSERHLDFDTVIDRKGTRSLKYDFAVRRGKPKDVLPLWVADMDFQTSSYITDALEDMVKHSVTASQRNIILGLCRTGWRDIITGM